MEMKTGQDSSSDKLKTRSLAADDCLTDLRDVGGSAGFIPVQGLF